MPIEPTSHLFDARGVNLAVHDWGGGGGAPVLLAHPTGFHGRIWAPIAAAARRGGSPRLLVRLPRSRRQRRAPPDAENYSWHGFADDALAVTEHLGLAGHPHLLACGHSKGGAALLLGEADAPGTYPRIWVYEPIMFPTRGAAPAERRVRLGAARRAAGATSGRRSRRRTRRTRRSRRSNVMTRGVTARLRRLRPARPRRRRVRAQVPRPRSRRRSTRWRRTTARSGGSRRSQSPVRVVCGETSTDISPSARRADRRTPARTGRSRSWPRRGHFGPQQDPDTTSRRCCSSRPRPKRRLHAFEVVDHRAPSARDRPRYGA